MIIDETTIGGVGFLVFVDGVIRVDEVLEVRYLPNNTAKVRVKPWAQWLTFKTAE